MNIVVVSIVAFAAFLCGVVCVIARDYHDLKNIIKQNYRLIKGKQNIQNGEILERAPNEIKQQQEADQFKIWYGE